jgi:Fe-Mn family superoxide dismutase
MHTISRRGALFLGGAATLSVAARPRAAFAQQVAAGSIVCPRSPTASTRTSRTSTRRPCSSTTGGTTRPTWRPQHGAARPPAGGAAADRAHPRVAGGDAEAIRASLRNNGGGHVNHLMFWEIMGGKGGAPAGELAQAVDRDLGGFERMKTDFNALGGRVFGSGWVFVTVDRDGKLALTSRPNQDTPLMDNQRVLIGNDVWEHAYYLKYQNRRPDYLQAWWNVVNWDRVAARYAAAKAGTLTI